MFNAILLLLLRFLKKAIHKAAGSILRRYNAHLKGCDTGCTKISPGFNLPAKYILHTGMLIDYDKFGIN